METTSSRPTATLTSLPPELLAHIVQFLPTASSVASLDRTSKSLHAFVEKDAWKTFARTRFPSTWPQESPSYRDTARTLTTLSKAWDRRAFFGSFTEPRDIISAFPGGRKIDRWKRPRGQTIGFTPQLDVYEEIGSTWQNRTETLAFSAGAEICIRYTQSHPGKDDDVRWTTYRPHSSVEGKDDVTTLHLLRHSVKDDHQQVLTGTANGDLQLLKIPNTGPPGGDVGITYFATQGMPVRASSLLQQENAPLLLAANLGDTKITLYSVDPEQVKICPSSQLNIIPPLRADGNPAQSHRTWSTTFLAPSKLAVGVGPSDEPINVYEVETSGLRPKPLRKFSLQNDFERVADGSRAKSTSSVYTIVPLSSTVGDVANGNVFLSGAYDGIVRLHDLRSRRDVEQAYVDPADDSPVYSILPRGREKLVVGASRHNLLKVFDMRLGQKAYNYLDANQLNSTGVETVDLDKNFNVFLRPNRASRSLPPGNNWSQGRNRQAESSVYSLASSSAHSPCIYAGLENAIMSLTFAEFLDPYPDPVYFRSWSKHLQSSPQHKNEKMLSGDILGLAMYDQGDAMKLCVQRSPGEMWKVYQQGKRRGQARSSLDERWKGAAESGP